MDQNQYRRVIGGFATGVTVVTALTADGAPEGMTANSLTSVSLEPILLAVCFHRDSGTITAIRETRAFVVNLLAEDERELSVRFAATRESERFAGIAYDLSARGIPVLPGGLGHLECAVTQILEGGDHYIVLGEVESCVERPGRPLLFFKGQYGRLQ